MKAARAAGRTKKGWCSSPPLDTRHTQVHSLISLDEAGNRLAAPPRGHLTAYWSHLICGPRLPQTRPGRSHRGPAHPPPLHAVRNIAPRAGRLSPRSSRHRLTVPTTQEPYGIAWVDAPVWPLLDTAIGIGRVSPYPRLSVRFPTSVYSPSSLYMYTCLCSTTPEATAYSLRYTHEVGRVVGCQA